MDKDDILLKSILAIIALGIWMLVLQNFNVFDNHRDVYVRGGNINSEVSGDVGIYNTVDVNIEEILGSPAAASGAYTSPYGEEHNSLGVTNY